jgi:hypothetical protein
LNAGWDRDALALELGDLDALGFDLALTGFGGDELAGLIGGNSGLTRRCAKTTEGAGQPGRGPLAPW